MLTRLRVHPHDVFCLFRQVRFLALSNVVAVSTQGHPNPLEYTKTYRLEHSVDCSVFSTYVNANGNAMVDYDLILLQLFIYNYKIP